MQPMSMPRGLQPSAGFYLVAAWLGASTGGWLPAQEARSVRFNQEIRPILSNHCFKCHGPAHQEAKLRLDDPRRATALLESGAAAIVPGKSSASELLRRVMAAADERMPPADTGDRLTAAQIALLRAWIDQGAPWECHWALAPPRPVAVPAAAAAAWVRNPIDAFVLAQLQQAGIRPAPEADRMTLVRRLTLDLIGLAPSPAEVEAFLADRAPAAYEKLVDRLLASPHYGERKARHWLDAARYADSNGYTIDGARSIWPYRDWVINAFNRDLPFDQFTLEQLAGDLLPHATIDQQVATGFHRNTPFNEEGGTDPEQFRVERTVDRTNTTGTVWLGLTVGCAQCHDHKFDPISQKEYYQLYAFFNNVDEPTLPVPRPEQFQQLQTTEAAIAALEKTLAALAQAGGAPFAQAERQYQQASHGGWHVLEAATYRSAQGARLRKLEDQSLLAEGTLPDADVYTVVAPVPIQPITALRLEALTHPSLPRGGPGRASRGNFVLSHFLAEINGRPVKFRRAVADHSQKKHDVGDALLGQPNKGWAINVERGNPNVSRQAIFIAESPVQAKPSEQMTITLRFSQTPKQYALGRFRLAVTTADETFLSLPIDAQAALLTAPAARTKEQQRRLTTALMHDPSVEPRARQLQELRAAKKKLEDAISTTLVLREAAKPRVTAIQRRGNFLNRGEAVAPGVPAVLPPLPAGKLSANRLDLARWLVRPDHPLTARVAVNRIWQQYFGVGLVETENDFGMQGRPPTHPELLDWLALAFVHSGWKVKALHRLIVTSATYRQSSQVRRDLLDRDPRNTLFARQNRLRLEAEGIRDVALSVSGLLTRRLGGPGVFPPQPEEVFSFTQSKRKWETSQGADRFRRGVYTWLWRQSQHPLMTTFDGPDAQTACTRRNRSNTPLQALLLANDPAFTELAQALAARVLRESPAEEASRLEYAFRLCLARPPRSVERERLRLYLHQQGPASDLAAWTAVARVLLNLDEFITRE